MANVVLQGVPSFAPPGVYVQLLFAQGQGGTQSAVYSALILANITSQGSIYSAPSFLLPSAATTFGVLGHSTVTSSADTVITGDLGLSPGTSITGFPPGTYSGSEDINNGAASAGQAAALSCYTAGQALSGATLIAGGTLANGVVLFPGTYSASSSLNLTGGTVTLNGGGNPNATFVFQIASTLTTAAATQVVLTGGATPQNVFWMVGSSATFGVGTQMVGTVIANASITDDGYSSVDGRLIALTAAVTLEGTTVVVPASQSAGTAVVPGTVYGPDTLVPMQTVQDAIGLFGPGSPGHLMVAAFRANNQVTPLYVAPVNAATGVQASQAITISAAGGSSQTTGVVQYAVDGKVPAQAVFGSTDSATTIATNLALAINGNVNLPVTASSSGAVVTVTAKVAGLRGNDLRGYASVVSGTGCSVNVSSPMNFTGGGGSDAAGYTATLNAIALNGQRYYYVIPEAGGDHNDGYTNGICAEVQSFIDSQALPSIGLRQRAVFGSNDTMANTTAVATSLNDPRCEIIQCNQLDLTPGELASTWVGALYNVETAPLTAQGVNFDSFGAKPASQPLWHVPAPLNGSAPSASDIQTAIINGVTPLAVGPAGTTRVVKRVTTRYYILGGPGNNQEVLDLRITDGGVVTICDQFFDEVQTAISELPASLIGPNPAAGSPPNQPGVLSPDDIKDVVVQIVNEFSSQGLINGPATLAGLSSIQNTNPITSIGVTVPLVPAALLHTVLVSGLQLNPVIV